MSKLVAMAKYVWCCGSHISGQLCVTSGTLECGFNQQALETVLSTSVEFSTTRICVPNQWKLSAWFSDWEYVHMDTSLTLSLSIFTSQRASCNMKPAFFIYSS